MSKIFSYENNPQLKEKEDLIQKQLEEKFKDILEILGYDIQNDENLLDTPRRMAKMILELTEGNRNTKPKLTFFTNDKINDETPVFVGPIAIKSLCSHHFLPFFGYAFIGYIPDKKLIGLSKIPRLVNWLMRRPHLQEKLTQMIVEEIEKACQPKGVVCMIKAKHTCMAIRGANEYQGWMTTIQTKGLFTDSTYLKAFMTFVKSFNSLSI